MDWIAAESGVAFGESEKATKAHRILADHGRGMTFLVGDGVVPSNEGRGYVLRRIIRRAVQQARTIGLDDLWRITDVVVEQMGPWYPELSRAPRPDPGDLEDRGGALLADARARAEALRGDRREGHDLGRGRVPAPRHVRLPARADEGARSRARDHDRRGDLHAAHVRAARALTRGRRASGGPRGRVRQAGRLRDRVRRLREDRGAHADRCARGARRRRFPRQAPRVAVLSRRAAAR